MESILGDEGRRVLKTIFNEGAQSASQALSRWLGRPVSLAVGAVDLVPLEEAAEVLGPPESLVAACVMGLQGPLSGWLLLVFEDRSGLALVDLLMQQPVGVASEWGEIEQSAAKETTNIVGCAYVGALAANLPKPAAPQDAVTQIIPTPPQFLHEFAGSLVEFALGDQILELDRVLLIRSQFTRENVADQTAAIDLNWTLLFVPSRESLDVLSAMFHNSETHSRTSRG